MREESPNVFPKRTSRKKGEGRLLRSARSAKRFFFIGVVGIFGFFAGERLVGSEAWGQSRPTTLPVPKTSAAEGDAVHQVTVSGQGSWGDLTKGPWGGGVDLQWMVKTLPRVRVGLAGGWMAWGGGHRMRAGAGIHVVVDELPIQPFLQATVGLFLHLQDKAGTWAAAWGGDLQIALGVDIPIARRWRLGAAFSFLLPLATENLAGIQSLHLRASLLF